MLGYIPAGIDSVVFVILLTFKKKFDKKKWNHMFLVLFVCLFCREKIPLVIYNEKKNKNEDEIKKKKKKGEYKDFK